MNGGPSEKTIALIATCGQAEVTFADWPWECSETTQVSSRCVTLFQKLTTVESNFHFCTFSIAHSNHYAGFRLYNFEQFFTFRNEIDVPVFENLKAYRNREWGIYIYSE